MYIPTGITQGVACNLDIATCAPCAVRLLPAKAFLHRPPHLLALFPRLCARRALSVGPGDAVGKQPWSPAHQLRGCREAAWDVGRFWGPGAPEVPVSELQLCLAPRSVSKPLRGRAEPLFSTSAAISDGSICVAGVTHGNHLWNRRSCWLGRGSGAAMGAGAVRGEPGEHWEGSSIPSSSSSSLRVPLLPPLAQERREVSVNPLAAHAAG